jgi:hypothetical protein
MRLPENLCLEDVGDVVARLRVPMDRTNVARALRAVSIEGVREPENRLGRWRIPRSKLVECVAACLLRRASRSPDRWALRPEKFVTAAAELMLRDAELEDLVPRRLRAEILERWRLVEERRRREREAKEAAERKRRARQAREAKARRLEYERVRRERVVLDWCYNACWWAAWEAVRAPGQPYNKDLPEAVQLRRDFPVPRPDWWLAPPDLRARMAEYLKDLANIPDEHPNWAQWIPPYQPGRAWPWRKPETGGPA